MFNKIFMAFVMTVMSTSVLASNNSLTDDRSDQFEQSAICYDYHYDPQTCGNLWYCEYSYFNNSCNYVDENGGGRSCASYNRDPRGCDRQENCRWDRRSNRCENRYDPYPINCSNYYEWRSCDAVQECFWDRRLNRCVNNR